MFLSSGTVPEAVFLAGSKALNQLSRWWTDKVCLLGIGTLTSFASKLRQKEVSRIKDAKRRHN